MHRTRERAGETPGEPNQLIESALTVRRLDSRMNQSTSKVSMFALPFLVPNRTPIAAVGRLLPVCVCTTTPFTEKTTEPTPSHWMPSS